MPVGMSYSKNNNNSDGGSGFEYLRAKLQVGKNAGRVYFLDQMEEGFDGAGNKVDVFRSQKFNTEDLPKLPALPQDITIPECQVVLDPEGNIVGIGPWNGSFKAKVFDFGPKTPDGSKPMSRIKDKPNKQKPGTTYKDVMFWCIWQITDHGVDDGLWLGATPYQFLKDKFFKREDGMTDIMGDPAKGNTHAARLREWGDALHLWDDDIEYPADGNVLPELLRRAKERGDELVIVVKNGNVDSIQATHSGVVRGVATFVDEEVQQPALPAGQADETFGK